MHPTLGSLRVFQAFSSPQFFSHSDGVPPPAPARVTQAVRCGQRKESIIQSRGKGLSQKARGPNVVKGSIPFLARPRELRGKMFKGLVLIESPHLTKRALDAGESARFSSVFSASAFLSLDGFAVPRPSASNADRWAVGQKGN